MSAIRSVYDDILNKILFSSDGDGQKRMLGSALYSFRSIDSVSRECYRQLSLQRACGGRGGLCYVFSFFLFFSSFPCSYSHSKLKSITTVV